VAGPIELPAEAARVCRYFTAVPAGQAPGAACAITKASAAWPNVGAGNAWPMVSLPLAAGNAYRSRMPPTAAIRGQSAVLSQLT